MMWLQRSKRSDAAAQKRIVILSLVSDPPKGYSFGGFRYAGSIPIVRNMLFHTQFLTSRNLICHSAFQPVILSVIFSCYFPDICYHNVTAYFAYQYNLFATQFL